MEWKERIARFAKNVDLSSKNDPQFMLTQRLYEIAVDRLNVDERDLPRLWSSSPSELLLAIEAKFTYIIRRYMENGVYSRALDTMKTIAGGMEGTDDTHLSIDFVLFLEDTVTKLENLPSE